MPTTDQDMATVGEYTETAEEAGLGDDLNRYAASSAKFAAIGGTIGSVFPGVGTAIGGLVGAGFGIVSEGVSDIIDLLDDGPAHVKEDPGEAEKAFHVYLGLGGYPPGYPKGDWAEDSPNKTGLAYHDWWKLYVEAGRPSIEVLEAAQRVAKKTKAAKGGKGGKGKRPPPPPPPPPKRRGKSKGSSKGFLGLPSPKQASTAHQPGGAPVDLQVLVEIPSARVSEGRFVKNKAGAQGFLLDLSRGDMLSGKWLKTAG